MILSIALKALRGRRLWLKVKRKYGLADRSIYLIMLPDSDREFNEAALRHVDDFLNYRKGNAVVILTTDKWTAANAQSFSKHIESVDLITLLDYYYYYHYFYYYGFSEQFIMVSLQGQHGKRLALSEGICGIDKEDMACLGLFIIRDWTGTEITNE
jgi:hypothetical protein